MKKLRSLLSMDIDHERRWSRYAAMAEDYKAGRSIVEIARIYRCSQGLVGKVRKMFQLDKRRPGSDPEVRKRVVERYKTGELTGIICSDEGIDRKTLWLLVKEAGVRLRQPKRNKNEKSL